MTASSPFTAGGPRSRSRVSATHKESLAPSFPALFEAAPGALALLSPTFKVIAVSDAYLHAIGSARADITGMNLVEVFPVSAEEGAGADTIRASLFRVVAERRPDTMAVHRYAVRGSAPDSAGVSERYWSVTNSPVLADHGQIALIIHQVTDVTDFVALHDPEASNDFDIAAQRTSADGSAEGRTAAELVAESQRSLAEVQAIARRSEQLFRGAFDAAGTGIALIAPDGRAYVDVNQALCDMLGYTKEELLELGWLAVTHPDDRARNLDEVNQFITGKVDTKVVRKRYIRKDGEVISVEVTDAFVPDPDGSPAYFITHVTDVTERDRGAQDNERLQAQLRQGQKMEAVGQLAGGVAHDFNNILSVILNYAGFVIEDLPPGDPRVPDVQEIVKASEKAAQLVHQLLAFSRQEVIEERIIGLNSVVVGLHDLLRRSLGEDTELVFDAAADLPPVKADPGQIEQVLLNLAVNGRDAMAGGGVLTVSTGIETVAEGDRLGLAAGTYARLAVADTGEGMDEATVERVFEPFFTTKPRGEGTGLGLATVYGIVKQASGGVYVDSQPGIGTTFSVYLPASDDAVGEFLKTEPGSVVGGTEAIVLVEDEDAVRHLATRILLANGYDVVSFADAPEALRFCRDNPTGIDLLLTDVVMPKMSGKSLSEQATRAIGPVKTLFMSGYTDEIIAKRGVLEDGENLLSKPFKAGELLAKVRSLLDA